MLEIVRLQRTRGPIITAVLILTMLLMPTAAQAAHNANAEDPCAGAPEANITDRDQARSVHRDSIDCVYFRSVSVGQTENQFAPLSLVTRGQMASFILNTLVNGGYADELPDGGGDPEFGDISGDTAEANINSLARAGIVRGYPDGSYRPRLTITRDQMASFMVQAANWAVGQADDGARADDHTVESDGIDRFADVAQANPHKSNIEAGADASPPLFRGVTANRFRPHVNVPRDQMATFLVNLLGYIFNPSQAPPVVVIPDTEVRAGEQVEGEIRNQADSATVEGCGVDEQALNDEDPASEDLEFAVTIPVDQPPGDCGLTFTIQTGGGADASAAQANGDGTFVRTVQITVLPPADGPGEPGDPDDDGGGGSGDSRRINIVAPETADTSELVTATATVTRNGNPVEGVIVTFTTDTAEGSPTPIPEGGTDTTDGNGEAEFQFSSTTTGTVVVRACFDRSGSGQRCDQTTVRFVGSQTMIEVVAPETADTGELVTATATVTNDGEPVEGTLVRFRAETDEESCGFAPTEQDFFDCLSGPGPQPPQGEDRTDEDGQAFFTFTMNHWGTVEVEACILLTEGERCDTTRVHFGGDPPQPEP